MIIICTCSTTNRTYTAVAQQVERVGRVTFAWTLCPHCDSYGRTRADQDFDVDHPQWHCQQVEAAMERAA